MLSKLRSGPALRQLRPFTTSPLARNRVRRYFRYGAYSATATAGLLAYSAKLQAQEVVAPVSVAPGSAFFNDAPSPGTTSPAFHTKSTASLFRTALVYELCQFGWLVDIAPRILSLANRFEWTKSLTHAFIRETFFAQFCGGESAEAVEPLMRQLGDSNILSILDLSIESDGDSNKDDDGEHVLAMLKHCVVTAARVQDAFVAVKVTGLGSTQALERVSAVLAYARESFYDISKEHDFEQFKKWIQSLPSIRAGRLTVDDSMIQRWFRKADVDKNGKVTWVDIADVVSLENQETRSLFYGRVPLVDGPHFSSSEKYRPEMTEQDWKALEQVCKRLNQLCIYAKENGVRLMLDAEQTWLQPAIDFVSWRLMSQFNTQSSLVYPTYQLYLTDAPSRLQDDFERSKRHNIKFAAKLVRGAYMTSERARAKTLSIRDPIVSSHDVTNRQYNDALTMLIPSSASLIVATQNVDSITLATSLQSMPDQQTVVYAQLLGMYDHVTYTLAGKGLPVGKYVPYGPIHEVIPYLLRRAQENRSVLSTGVGDRALVWAELRRRFLSFFGVDRILEHLREDEVKKVLDAQVE